MRILRISMNGEEYPNYTYTKAFNKVFDDVKTIWWEKEPNINSIIVEEVTKNKYDAVFLQIQGAGIIKNETARIISENSIGFNWTGDVRTNLEWYIELGQNLITCFTNMHDVNVLRSLGLRAEYLQTGYDTSYYVNKNRDRNKSIVFCANYYPHADFPLSNLRKDLIISLKKEFGHSFIFCGDGWNQANLIPEENCVSNSIEAEIYNNCSIAINCSHFNYSRYSSDRLLRELACGAFVLSHNYTDIEQDFDIKKHLDVWDSIPELIQKCHYYLENPKVTKELADNGSKYVSENCTWVNRMEDFKNLIIKYKK